MLVISDGCVMMAQYTSSNAASCIKICQRCKVYIPVTYRIFSTAAIFFPLYEVATLCAVHKSIFHLIVLLDPHQGCHHTSLPSSFWSLEPDAVMEVLQLYSIAAYTKDQYLTVFHCCDGLPPLASLPLSVVDIQFMMPKFPFRQEEMHLLYLEIRRDMVN